MDLRGLAATPNAYFSFLENTKQLLLMTIYDMTLGNGASFRTHRQMNGRAEGQMDRQMEVEIV